VCAHAAAVLTERSRLESPYDPPASSNPEYFAVGVSKLKNDVVISDNADFNDFQNAGINLASLTPNFSGLFTTGLLASRYSIYGSRTLATDDRLLNINTRIAINLTIQKLRPVAAKYIQTRSNPKGAMSRSYYRDIFAVMEDQYNAGALNADDVPNPMSTAFRIDMVPVTVGGKSIQKPMIYARFVDATEQVQIDLLPVSTLPV
jgi:hypothetical protein